MPIARAVVDAAALRSTDEVLELGAGTGLVTRLAAPRVSSRQ
jgi:16S rRNA A1518/A1519 N6-dimethyltransferase RsmA/KsgA/DIM1 with predicted DNA glycosylase/AP lyase activity